MPEPVPNAPGVWYRICIRECPVCGRGKEWRERMPPPRPPIEERYEYRQAYDYCNA